jgi:hypothetical protein
MVFVRRVLRKIFVSERDEVTGGGEDCINEELYDLYCSSHISRLMKQLRMSWAGHVAYTNACRVLVMKPEGK